MTTSALSDPVTRKVIRGRRVRAAGLIVLGVVVSAAAPVAYYVEPLANWKLKMAAGPAALALVLLFYGIQGLVHTARIRDVLAKAPWHPVTCRYRAKSLTIDDQPGAVFWVPEGITPVLPNGRSRINVCRTPGAPTVVVANEDRTRMRPAKQLAPGTRRFRFAESNLTNVA